VQLFGAHASSACGNIEFLKLVVLKSGPAKTGPAGPVPMPMH